MIGETIAAIATAAGEAGLAVVRLSGADALAIADRVFRGAAPLRVAKGNTLHHGWAVRSAHGAAHAVQHAARHAVAASAPATRNDPSGRPESSAPAGAEHHVDEVVAAVFRAPRSYTREDVVELSCHGGRQSAERVLAALLAAGARLAGPGEFTLRAFLNGRIDLAQAEAIADLIHAESEAAHDLALSQLAGELSRSLAALAERLQQALAEIEARVDFAEDVGGIEVPESVIDELATVAAELDALLEGSRYARAVREGVKLPLIGRPNAGKSSLFNALLGEARAIVTEQPGTTRDRVSETIEVAGVRVTLSDTAGLREHGDEVEQIGVARAHAALDESAFVLWVVDGSESLSREDLAIAQRLAGKHVLVALNKRDLATVVDRGELVAQLEPSRAHRIVSVSAARGDGVPELREVLAAMLGARSPAAARPARPDRPASALARAVGNPRHVEALSRARGALERAIECGRRAAPGEIVALELREALSAIGEVTGTTVGDDLLERIFRRFCVGK